MAELRPSSFCSYELTPQEEKQGSILTIENIYVLQNMLARRAQEKIELATSRRAYDEYWQREAELQGEISVLKEILAAHTTTMENLSREDIPVDYQNAPADYRAASEIFSQQS